MALKQSCQQLKSTQREEKQARSSQLSQSQQHSLQSRRAEWELVSSLSCLSESIAAVISTEYRSRAQDDVY